MTLMPQMASNLIDQRWICRCLPAVPTNGKTHALISKPDNKCMAIRAMPSVTAHRPADAALTRSCADTRGDLQQWLPLRGRSTHNPKTACAYLGWQAYRQPLSSVPPDQTNTHQRLHQPLIDRTANRRYAPRLTSLLQALSIMTRCHELPVALAISASATIRVRVRLRPAKRGVGGLRHALCLAQPVR